MNTVIEMNKKVEYITTIISCTKISEMESHIERSALKRKNKENVPSRDVEL